MTYEIGQANNALIYPGLGLGVISSDARLLTDRMISVAAHSIGGIVDAAKPGAAVLPPVSMLTQFSRDVAVAVAKEAIEEGLNRHPIANAAQAVDETKWTPVYRRLA